jgi:Sec-independent protein translocase protein TatA
MGDPTFVLMVAILALLAFGHRSLVALVRQLGDCVREFKRGVDDIGRGGPGKSGIA